jgi:hypothetical protein
MKELVEALQTCNGKSPGPRTWKHHLRNAKATGREGNGGHFPEERRRANVIPIVKHGKDPEFPDNYRPISLTKWQNGVAFDKRLTWKTHVKEAKFKAKRRLNILRCLAGTTWGADREVLLKAHHAVILSALRYRETEYGAASDKTLKTLDPIHNEGLRISIGAFCVTKTTEVLREAGELSLKEIRNKNMAICGVRIKAKRNHPLNRSSDTETRERLEEKHSLLAPFVPVPCQWKTQRTQH